MKRAAAAEVSSGALRRPDPPSFPASRRRSLGSLLARLEHEVRELERQGRGRADGPAYPMHERCGGLLVPVDGAPGFADVVCTLCHLIFEAAPAAGQQARAAHAAAGCKPVAFSAPVASPAAATGEQLDLFSTRSGRADGESR